MLLAFRILIFSCFSFTLAALTPEAPKIVARYYFQCETFYGASSGEVVIDRVAGTYEQWSRSCETTMWSYRGSIKAGKVMQKTITAIGTSETYPPEWRPLEPHNDGSFEIDGNELIERNEDQRIIKRYVIVEN